MRDLNMSLKCGLIAAATWLKLLKKLKLLRGDIEIFIKQITIWLGN